MGINDDWDEQADGRVLEVLAEKAFDANIRTQAACVASWDAAANMATVERGPAMQPASFVGLCIALCGSAQLAKARIPEETRGEWWRVVHAYLNDIINQSELASAQRLIGALDHEEEKAS